MGEFCFSYLPFSYRTKVYLAVTSVIMYWFKPRRCGPTYQGSTAVCSSLPLPLCRESPSLPPVSCVMLCPPVSLHRLPPSSGTFSIPPSVCFCHPACGHHEEALCKARLSHVFRAKAQCLALWVLSICHIETSECHPSPVSSSPQPQVPHEHLSMAIAPSCPSHSHSCPCGLLSHRAEACTGRQGSQECPGREPLTGRLATSVCRDFGHPHFTAVRNFRKLVISYPVWLRKLKFREKKLAGGHGITEPDPTEISGLWTRVALVRSDLNLSKFRNCHCSTH